MDTAILTVLIILAATVLLLVFEVVRIDVVAIGCMLALAWTGVLDPDEALSGFSSNAVIAMMAVMILGHGIARTGIMERFSRMVLKRVGDSRPRVVALMSISVGILSGFIQNIGAAALFLPGILNISRRARIPASSLIMPIGFAAILGGTLSMVGSGPLILINDLLGRADLEPYGLFSVTPVGLILLVSGVSFFLVFGRFVLPASSSSGSHPSSEQDRLVESLHLPHHIWHFAIPEDSSLVGETHESAGVWRDYGLHILGICRERDVEYAPWRHKEFEGGQELALLGSKEDAARFAEAHGLIPEEEAPGLDSLLDPERAGFAEVIVPPRAALVGETIREYSLRKRYAVEPVLLFSRGEEIRGDFSDERISTGDTIIVFGLWEKIADLKEKSDFVVATPFEVERRESSKALLAALCFLAAIGLALGGAPISIAFFSGAMAMVLTRVLSMQEAYQAIEWKVVFLLAGLIPLGAAMQKTGAAAFLAEGLMGFVQGRHPILLVITVAVLSTAFSQFMSNVGAVVVLAPLVISMAKIGGLDPRPLALMAAVCAANSFILPTHQVNALLMSPGGYRNADYLKAGTGMTLIFLVVVVSFFWFFFI